MRIKSQRDFWSGVMFMAFGAFFAGFGAQYPIGMAAKMGPGYFPTLLGLIVILLGMIISVGSLSSKSTDEKVDRFDWRALLLILGAVVSFALLLKRLGLILSLLILIAISSYASHEFSWKATLTNAAMLIMVCLMIFVWALKLQFRLWPSFIGN